MGLKKAKAKHQLYRKVTHTKYTGIRKIGDKGPQSWLPKTIIPLDKFFYKTGKYGYPTMNDEYIEASVHAWILLLIGGSFICKYFIDLCEYQEWKFR